jgi:tetratricopeptide (TPR) repeat protein
MRASRLLLALVLLAGCGAPEKKDAPPVQKPAPPPEVSDPPPHDASSDPGLAKRRLEQLERGYNKKDGDTYDARVEAAKLCFTLADKKKTDDRSDRVEFAERGVDHARAAIAKDAARVEAFYFRALCSGRKLDSQLLPSPSEAKRLPELAIEAEKRDEKYDCAGPHRFLACFYSEAPGIMGGDWDKAVKHFERAIELVPSCPENYLEYGEALKKQGDDDLLPRARKMLKESLSLSEHPDPKHPGTESDYREFIEKARALLKELPPEPPAEHRSK